MINIIEIKARCHRQDAIRQLLQEAGADFKGLDHQVDTYFRVGQGRLKLREGNIENCLIHYDRGNQKGPKHSKVTLYRSNPESTLKEVLTASLGILTVVDKQREIYFIDNVKFHLDRVQGLGTFVEIEAIDEQGLRNTTDLQQQCQHYLDLFEITASELVAVSYSDLLLQEQEA